MDAALLKPDREEQVVAQGDVTLHLEHFVPSRQPQAQLVFVHGFASYGGLYRHVARSFSEAGFAVTTFDCRGHGLSTGRRGYAKDFGVFLDDLDLVIAAARRNLPTLPLILMGHSHGGTIVADYVLSGRATPSRLVLVAPWLGLTMKVPAWKQALSRITARVWPTLTLSNGIRGADVSRNPLVIENFSKDPLVHHVATPRWFEGVLAAQQRIRDGAAKLAIPTLLLLAGDDRIVSNAALDDLARAAPQVIDTKHYPDLFHELFLEIEWNRVVDDILAWLSNSRRLT